MTDIPVLTDWYHDTTNYTYVCCWLSAIQRDVGVKKGQIVLDNQCVNKGKTSKEDEQKSIGLELCANRNGDTKVVTSSPALYYRAYNEF